MAITMEKSHYVINPSNKLGSLNYIVRKKENQRIVKENEMIARRLFCKRPHISVRQLNQDYHDRHLKYKHQIVKMRSAGRLSTSMDYHKESNAFLPPIKNSKDFISQNINIVKNIRSKI